MAFVFEGLLGSTITLAILYFFLAIFLYYKLFWLQTHSTVGLNTRKLFAMSCLLTSILRCMSFSSMAILCIGRVDFAFNTDNLTPIKNDDNNRSSDTYSFFEKSLIVLFDFPDFSYISAYVLLLIIWAETYLKSRRHWLSSIKFRRIWMISYFIFNIILYSTQLSLYSLLFIPEINNDVLMNLIYICLAAFSFFLPITWICVYFFLAIQFSGFPYASPYAKRRLKYLNRLGTLWTCARFAWGLLALTSVVEGWLTTAQKSPLVYSILLIIIFTVTEIIPILVSVYKPVLQSLAENNEVISGNTTAHTSSSHYPLLRPSASGGVLDMESYDDEAIYHLGEGVSNPLQQLPQNREVIEEGKRYSANRNSHHQNQALPSSLPSNPVAIPNNRGLDQRKESSDSADWSLASRSPHVGVWDYLFGGH